MRRDEGGVSFWIFFCKKNRGARLISEWRFVVAVEEGKGYFI
jgi:hypothetical protein